ncbi:hypothetical protein LHK12_08180 [Providencia rettgeri]|nr:hypothetical protein [Providencia rettgeri]
MKKVVIALCALCAFGSVGGIVLAGMNIYTRSTTPLEQGQPQSLQHCQPQSNSVILK